MLNTRSSKTNEKNKSTAQKTPSRCRHLFSGTLDAIAWADVAVIVHPSAGFDSPNEEDVARLFLGKSKSFPAGAQAVPVNQTEGAAARDKFNEAICKKNANQYKAYW